MFWIRYDQKFQNRKLLTSYYHRLSGICESRSRVKLGHIWFSLGPVIKLEDLHDDGRAS